MIIKTINNLNRAVDTLTHYFFKENVFWQAMTLGTLGTGFFALATLLAPERYTNEKHASEFFETFIINNLLVVAHIGFSLAPLLIGPWLFNRTFRNENLKLHKRCGQIYVIGCLIGAIAVFPVALANPIGFVGRLGFGVMACTWFSLTYFAYTAAINKDFHAHRRWMMRSYALTFAFVHVNLTYKLILPYMNLSPEGIKILQSMASWMVNLLFVEIYLTATTFKGKYVGRTSWLKNLITPYNAHDKFYINPVSPKITKT